MDTLRGPVPGQGPQRGGKPPPTCVQTAWWQGWCGSSRRT